VLFIREIDLDKSERILAILSEKEVSRTEQISKAHVYRVTKCVDSDSGVKIKI
jgi:hypothetical protein